MSTAAEPRISPKTASSANGRSASAPDRYAPYYSNLDRSAIDGRLHELDQEWNVERILQTKAAGLVIASFVLGAVSSRKWFALSGLVGSFLLQQAFQRWSPPVPVLRGLGFRTADEIERERQQLLRAREKNRSS